MFAVFILSSIVSDVHFVASEARRKQPEVCQRRLDNCNAPKPASTISDCDSAITEIKAAIEEAKAAGVPTKTTQEAKKKLEKWEKGNFIVAFLGQLLPSLPTTHIDTLLLPNLPPQSCYSHHSPCRP